MNTTDLIRVVHYPDSPFDLGVVKRDVQPNGEPFENGPAFVVLWANGDADHIDILGHLDETVSGADDPYGDAKRLRVVTVSRSREHCRRVYEWAEAAFAGWS